jgi:nucleoside-diphosphate-sugar epimerase
MKVLLIGHEGYVGSRLYEELKAQGHLVKGWGSKENLFSLEARRIQELGIEAVVNCAAAFDRKSERLLAGSPSDWVNVEGVRHLVECLAGTRTRLVQISTKDVFGPVYGPADVIVEERRNLPRFLVDDDHPFRPRTAYGKSKLMGEYMTESHAFSTVIRLSTVYTEDAHRNMGWIGRMCSAYLAGERLRLSGDGKQFRDALHVSDLAELIGRVLSAPAEKVGGVKLNAGGGPASTFSLLEFVELLSQGGNPAGVDFTPFEDLGFAFSNRVARELLGWSPRQVLRDRLPVLKRRIQAAISEGKTP